MRRYGEDYKLTQEDLDVIATYMNDEIRECVHNDMLYDTPEDFLREYVVLDPDLRFFLKVSFLLNYRR